MALITSPESILIYLCTAAFLSSAWMFRSSLTGRALPGCGSGSSCDDVTTGRWSRVGSVPVSFFGTALYLAMLAGAILSHWGLQRLRLWERASHSLAFSSLLAIGAAVWFTALQVLVIRRLCRWCLFTHVCAAAAGMLALSLMARPPQSIFLGALVCLLVWIVAQVIFAPRLYTVIHSTVKEDVQENKASLIAAKMRLESAPVQDVAFPDSPGDTKQISPPPLVEKTLSPGVTGEVKSVDFAESSLSAVLDDASAVTAIETAPLESLPRTPRTRLHAAGDKISLSPHLWPVLGPREARHLIIDQLDYTCKYCRDLHTLLLQAIAGRDDLAVLLMPVPMESDCHPAIRKTLPEHRHACLYASHALAVFRAQPEAFAEFDRWLFDAPHPPPPDDMRRVAQRIVGPDALEVALADPWLARRTQEAIDIYAAVGGGAMPKLIFSDRVVSGPVRTYEELEKILNDALVG